MYVVHYFSISIALYINRRGNLAMPALLACVQRCIASQSDVHCSPIASALHINQPHCMSSIARLGALHRRLTYNADDWDTTQRMAEKPENLQENPQKCAKRRVRGTRYAGYAAKASQSRKLAKLPVPSTSQPGRPTDAKAMPPKALDAPMVMPVAPHLGACGIKSPDSPGVACVRGAWPVACAVTCAAGHAEPGLDERTARTYTHSGAYGTVCAQKVVLTFPQTFDFPTETGVLYPP